MAQVATTVNLPPFSLAQQKYHYSQKRESRTMICASLHSYKEQEYHNVMGCPTSQMVIKSPKNIYVMYRFGSDSCPTFSVPLISDNVKLYSKGASSSKDILIAQHTVKKHILALSNQIDFDYWVKLTKCARAGVTPWHDFPK